MHNLFAVASSTSNSSVSGIVAIAFALILGVPAIVIPAIGKWKAFVKAGKPGWAALVPFYDNWVMCRIAGKPGWWSLLGLTVLVTYIPMSASLRLILDGIIFITLLIISFIIVAEIGKRFGKGGGFVFILMFFPIFAWPILGFGDAQYTDPVDPTSSMDPHNLNQQTFVQSSQAQVAQQVMPDVMQQPLPQTT